jgi:hypothetical protein
VTVVQPKQELEPVVVSAERVNTGVSADNQAIIDMAISMLDERGVLPRGSQQKIADALKKDPSTVSRILRKAGI